MLTIYMYAHVNSCIVKYGCAWMCACGRPFIERAGKWGECMKYL